MGLVEPEMGFPGPTVQPEAGLAYPGRSILSIASTNRIHGLCEEIGSVWQLEVERLQMLMQVSVIARCHVQYTSNRPYIDLSNEIHVAVKSTSNPDVTQLAISSTAIHLGNYEHGPPCMSVCPTLIRFKRPSR